eukprot:gene12945-biopygen16465
MKKTTVASTNDDFIADRTVDAFPKTDVFNLPCVIRNRVDPRS